MVTSTCSQLPLASVNRTWQPPVSFQMAPLTTWVAFCVLGGWPQ